MLALHTSYSTSSSIHVLRCLCQNYAVNDPKGLIGRTYNSRVDANNWVRHAMAPRENCRHDSSSSSSSGRRNKHFQPITPTEITQKDKIPTASMQEEPHFTAVAVSCTPRPILLLWYVRVRHVRGASRCKRNRHTRYTTPNGEVQTLEKA